MLCQRLDPWSATVAQRHHHDARKRAPILAPLLRDGHAWLLSAHCDEKQGEATLRLAPVALHARGQRLGRRQFKELE